MKAFDIIGYTYQAEILCRDCAYDESLRIFRAAGGKVESLSTESNLDSAALYLGFDRYDESTFDSDDFPKVVFVSQVEDDECCNRCGVELIACW